MTDLNQKMGMIGAVMMPLFNIPLIFRIVQRKTSKDISLTWAFGIWGCILLMVPSGVNSPDLVLKSFAISNAILFTLVVVAVVAYRKGP